MGITEDNRRESIKKNNICHLILFRKKNGKKIKNIPNEGNFLSIGRKKIINLALLAMAEMELSFL